MKQTAKVIAKYITETKRCRKKCRLRLLLLCLAFSLKFPSFAHPTGNMITVGDKVLWAYIDPLNDPEHHACIMAWEKAGKPKVLLRSEFPASDFMLYHRGEDIYVIERRHVAAAEKFEVRILKFQLGKEPDVIWNWLDDPWRIGEGGFFMTSDEQLVFGKYPNIYLMRKGEAPTVYFDFDHRINRIKPVSGGQILLLGENSCWLTDRQGKVLKQWDNLICESVEGAPLGRNQIFDADYKNGEFLTAYWGNRTFEAISPGGERKTLLQLRDPWVPHWVGFFGDAPLLFSSKLVFTGETPKPKLMMLEPEGKRVNLWYVDE